MSACIGQQAHAHALMCLRFRAIVRLCELSQQERKHMEWRAHAAKHEFSHKTVARRREVFPRTCLKQPMCCWRGDKKRDRHHFWEQMEMGNNVCCWIRLDVNGLMGIIFTPLPSLKSSPPKFLLIHRKTKVSWGHAEIVFHRLLFVRKTCKFAKRQIALLSTPELSNTFVFFVQARCDKRWPLWKN